MVEGRPHGPVDADTLRRWIAERRLDGRALSWTDGEADWSPLGQRTAFAEDLERVAATPPPAPTHRPPPPDVPPGEPEKQLAMWMHLSGLLGWFLPLAGLVVPLVLWMQYRETSLFIDRHGRTIANAWISYLIYGAACGILIFLIVGIPLLLALMVLSLVGLALAAAAASRGEVREYPLAIRFLS